jgi:predicted permease
VLRDLRHAVRVLLKAKGWTLVVLVSLALGIGANTALFSAVNGLLIKTIPVSDPGGLVRLRWTGENDVVRNQSGYGQVAASRPGYRVSASFSYPMVEALRAGNETLDGIVAGAPRGRLNVVVDGQAELASGFVATGNYFDVLGVGAALGRVITVADDRAGAPLVTMISHRFWERQFGLDPSVIGRVIRVNSVPAAIVGVLPAGYTGVQRPIDDGYALHLPLAAFTTAFSEPGRENRLADATDWWLAVMGRLRQDATPAQVQGNLDGVFRAAARSDLDAYVDGLAPEERSRSRNQDLTTVAGLLVDSASRGLYDASQRASRQALILGVVVGLVLLIVCANVATLLLSRATSRQKEIAVRLSVGATRRRLIGQLMTESVLLSLLGGALGVLVGLAARRLLPFAQTTAFDWRVFAFVATLSLATGVVFSLVPALRATRVDVSGALKEHSRSVAQSRTVLSKTLIVAQVAVSLVLLVGAGLFMKTLGNLRQVDIGFNPNNVLLFRVDPMQSGYTPDESPAVFDRVADGLRNIPGVEAVSLSRMTLLSGSTWSSTMHLEGGAQDGFSTHMMSVSADFFETMEIPILAGRGFEPQDREDAPGVIVLNTTAARELFGNENPLGRRVGFSPEENAELEVVGIVQDVKYSSMRTAAPPTAFRSTMQSPPRAASFVVRTAGSPETLTPAVRDTVRRIDPTLPLRDVSTQSAEIEERLSDERLYALAYTSFGGLATLLAAIGLFGLSSYNVTQRTNEIGIRMALGAEASGVARMVMRESLVLVVVGVAAGVGGVMIAGRLVASLLYDLAPTDPITIAQAAAMLICVSAVAGYLPARRAARVDPLVALQDE